MIDYATKVAYHLETFPEFRSSVKPRDIVGKLAVAKFADGEMEVEVRTSLRGKDVFLFSGAGRNSSGLSVDECKMELYHSIDALRRAQAERITLFEPYCSPARSDRPTRRNSVGFWVHYKTLMGLGVSHVLTYQLHSVKSKTIFDPAICSIDDIPLDGLIEEYITKNFIGTPERLEQEIKKQWIFCSVDAGGEGLAKKYANDFGCPLIIAHKSRDYSTANRIDSIQILSDTSIEDREVWIVDDMVDTAGSIFTLTKELLQRKVRKINVATAHPVLSHKAIERLQQLYKEKALQHFVAVDTIECDEELQRQLPCLRVVSSARHSADIIMRIHEQKSMSLLFNNFSINGCLDSLQRQKALGYDVSL